MDIYKPLLFVSITKIIKQSLPNLPSRNAKLQPTLFLHISTLHNWLGAVGWS